MPKYYKIYKVMFHSFCAECQKKELAPDESFDFLIDETEYEKIIANLGTENRLCFKRGCINMKYVGGIKYLRLDDEPLKDAFADIDLEKPLK